MQRVLNGSAGAGLIKNILWLNFEKILRMALNVFVMAMVVRYLGKGDFGILSYYIAFVFLLEPLWSFGSNQILKSEMVKNPDRNKCMIFSISVFKIFSSSIIFFAVLFSGFLGIWEEKFEFLIAIILVSAFFFRSFDSIEHWYDSQIKSKYNAITKTIAFVLISVLKLLAVWFKAPLYVFAILFSVEYLLVAWLQVVFLFYTEKLAGDKWFDFILLKDILKKSVPVFFADVCVVIFMRVDQILLGNFIGKEVVGEYAVAQRLCEMWYFIPSAIAITYFAPIVSLVNKDDVNYRKRLLQLYQLVTLISLSITIFFLVAGAPIVRILFGVQYHGSAGILSIYVLSSIFIFWGIAQEPWDLANNMMSFRFKRILAGCLTGIVAYLILIPIFGSKGAAWARLGSFFIAYCFFNLFHSKTRIIFYYQLQSLKVWNSIKLLKKLF